MTQHTTFMITAAIKPGHHAQLRELLASMNSFPGFANPRNPLIPYWQLSNLHVARFTILDANTNEDIRQYGKEPSYWPPTLCFIGDIDGCRDTFLAELVIRAENGLREIFSHCAGFDEPDQDILTLLRNHSHRPNANYINWAGRTLIQIREDIALRHALQSEIKVLASRNERLSPIQTWRYLQQFTEQEIQAGRLTLSEPVPASASWHLQNLLHLLGIPVILLVLSPIFVLISPFYIYQLRRQERSDPENTEEAEPTHVATLSEQEDIDVTNHFNVFGQVKPGRLRLATIRMGLLLLNYTSRHIYKRGYLTRIQTIHFARWVLLDDNRRVYFASNYDGSADTYMDDFINKVAWGLNLVFSNGVGYPKTDWLIKGGAENEEKYKRTLRRNQLPSESWYKAYPGLTAVDLARNQRLRAGLNIDNPGQGKVREWLKLL